MIKEDVKESIALKEESNNSELTAKIIRAFTEMEKAISEDLRKSAELQSKSVASAMAMPSDSIY